MNFEQLLRLVNSRRLELRDERRTFVLLRYYYELLAWKLRKLKLGAVSFVVKEVEYSGIPVYRRVEMRFTRQDTSREEELSPEHRLKALGWQWNFSNVAAFFLVLAMLIFAACVLAYSWYLDKFPAFVSRDPRYDEIIYLAMRLVADAGTFGSRSFALRVAEGITAFCSKFGFLL